jgi:hypothetical protein
MDGGIFNREFDVAIIADSTQLTIPIAQKSVLKKDAGRLRRPASGEASNPA